MYSACAPFHSIPKTPPVTITSSDPLLAFLRLRMPKLTHGVGHRPRTMEKGGRMNGITKRISRVLMLVLSPAMLFVPAMTAQVETTTKTAQGIPQKEVTVERGEVVNVSGNDLFVKMENGEIRHFPNVPETARVAVNGQELGIHDLKPGMKLERTITVTTMPEVVTTVQAITGKVWQVMPPSTVILTLDNGENQQFTVPEGQQFTVNGEKKDLFGLRKGMVVSATKVTEVPET